MSLLTPTQVLKFLGMSPSNMKDTRIANTFNLIKNIAHFLSYHYLHKDEASAILPLEISTKKANDCILSDISYRASGLHSHSPFLSTLSAQTPTTSSDLSTRNPTDLATCADLYFLQQRILQKLKVLSFWFTHHVPFHSYLVSISHCSYYRPLNSLD